MSRKTDLINEINSMINEVNKGLQEVEKQGFASSSHAIDKMEQLRLDKMSYLNTKGYFKKANSSMNIKTLEKELAQVKKVSSMKTSTVQGIQQATRKGWKSFNKKAKEEGRKTLSQKEYSKLRHDFELFRSSNLSQMLTSEQVVKMSRLTSDEEIKKLTEFSNNNDESETKEFLNEIAKKHRINLESE